MTDITIREYTPDDSHDDFLRVPDRIYRDDPNYIAPLEFELRDRLSRSKNPFFEHGDARYFVAFRNDQPVGRVSASRCDSHLALHQDEAGFFGFFDTIHDEKVSTALLGKAESWIRDQGLKTMRGPYSLHINEETGLLVDGFDSKPAFFMPHHRPYQGSLAEAYGLSKAEDLFAWKYITDTPPKRAQRAWAQINALPEVQFRSVDKSKMSEEVEKLVELYNDAWKDNWGFVPWSKREVDELASMFKLLIDPSLAFFAEIHGEPVAMVVCLPNLNEAMEDLNGKLFPLGWAKLLWRLKITKIRSARLVMLGIREDIRKQKRYGALSTSLYAELTYRGMKSGYRWAELSWTLESNRPINLGIKAMGGKVYRRYRVYEKRIG